MGFIHVPTTSADDWRRLLAKPETQWRKGYSARTLAHCWDGADGFPPSVAASFSAAGGAFPRDVSMLLGLPERRVPLPGGSRASQTDLFVLAGSSDGVMAICVEGKVNETFGPHVSEWLKEDAGPGKQERLAFLANRLGIEGKELGPLRYQLLHRTASALIESAAFGARHALMLVHSFSPADAGFSDFGSFAGALGAAGDVAPGQIVTIPELRDGVRLHLGWVRGEPEYLQA